MTNNTIRITGSNLIAGVQSRKGINSYSAFDPRSGKPLKHIFCEAAVEEVNDAVIQAEIALADTVDVPLSWRVDLLNAIADSLEANTHPIVETAEQETRLGLSRLQNEHARMCDQIRLFAQVVQEGSFLEIMIDTEDGTYPDIRRMQLPIGPVAVFGASNFPLAFGVAGGDTVSALAAGCSVIVKAHPSHPATSEICARSILGGLELLKAPRGLFSLLHGNGPEVGKILVSAPGIKAVAFTGSRSGGRALFDIASARPDPIPVYAEMGSVNPLFVTTSAIKTRSAEIVSGLTQSITLGGGQFCTKPGLIFLVENAKGNEFVKELSKAFLDQPMPCLLNRPIRDNLRTTLDRTLRCEGVDVILGTGYDEENMGFYFPIMLLSTNSRMFRKQPSLADEHFGAVAIIVWCKEEQEFVDLVSNMEGSLTVSLHCEKEDSRLIQDFLPIAQRRCGRIVYNGYPTGVRVTHAMHHGGPYPATTAVGYSSVGSTAIRRFLKPVAFQNFNDTFLPPALKNSNPLGLSRMVNGHWTKQPI